jgi:predicted NBD/HSP70 family sugar kinase
MIAHNTILARHRSRRRSDMDKALADANATIEQLRRTVDRQAETIRQGINERSRLYAALVKLSGGIDAIRDGAKS